MGIRFEHISTRGGDGGQSSIAGGLRLGKSEPVFEVLGNLDELSVSLGNCRLSLAEEQEAPVFHRDLTVQVRWVQEVLVRLGGLVAGLEARREPWVGTGDLEHLEHLESGLMKGLEFKGFIHPGACRVGLAFDHARTVARRCERSMVAYRDQAFRDDLGIALAWMNRLSDYLFVAARQAALQRGITETE